ncbi:MAG TPA: hypothetical protein VMW04_02835 [Patescibacteria group bacterium]|nr:hypothetical protein [Patescibacteria group bacterium]
MSNSDYQSVLTLIFLASGTIGCWLYAVKGLKSKKITVAFRRMKVAELTGKSAIKYSLIWIVFALLLTICTVKYLTLVLAGKG